MRRNYDGRRRSPRNLCRDIPREGLLFTACPRFQQFDRKRRYILTATQLGPVLEHLLMHRGKFSEATMPEQRPQHKANILADSKIRGEPCWIHSVNGHPRTMIKNR